MLLSRENLVYRLVLIAFICPIFAAFFDSKAITHIPDILSLSLFSILFINNQVRLSFSYRFYFFILILSYYCINSIIIHGSIASMGGLAVVVLSIVYFKILDHNEIDLKRLVKNLSAIYLINVLFIYFEILVKIFGYEYIIVDLISAKDLATVIHYKTTNSAALLRNLGFNFGGANSLLLGSQSASMLTLYSLLWFSRVFKVNMFSGLKTKNGFFFIISLFLYPFVATMSSNIVLVIFIFLLICVFNNSRLNNIKTVIFLSIILLPFYKNIIELIMFRMKTADDYMEYSYTFFQSFVMIKHLNLDLFSQLFGAGRGSLSGVSHAGDFGLALILYEAGFVFVALVSSALLLIFFRVIRLIKRSKHSLFLSNPWYTFMSVNIILSLGWFISLGHYSLAIESGGRHLFALHVALTLISIKKVKNLNNPKQLNLVND